MATLKSVLVPGKALKGGRHKVRISLSHNGDFRYILTDIILNSEKEFKNGQIVKRPDAAILNTKLRGLLQRYQKALDEMECTSGLTCSELVYMLLHDDERKHRTLASLFNEYVEYAKIKQSTRKVYMVQFNAISSSIGQHQLLENIDHRTVLVLDKKLRDKKLKPGTRRAIMTLLLVLINYATRSGYVQFRVHPFFGYELPQAEVRDSWLTVDQIKAIRDIKLSSPVLAKCRDIFLLSYYLGGINMADLININFAEQTDTLHYVRKKTEDRPKINKYVEFDIPDEAKPIINRYIDSTGYLGFTECQRKTAAHEFIRYNMHRLSILTNIPNLIYYSARKSFSQHAFMLGISELTIDYILGHRIDKDSKSLYKYVTVTPELATKALRIVLDNLKK